MADEKKEKEQGKKPPLPRRAWSQGAEEASEYRAVKERLDAIAPAEAEEMFESEPVTLYGGAPERGPATNVPEMPAPAYGGPPIQRSPLLLLLAPLLSAGVAYAATGSAVIALIGLIGCGAVLLVIARILR